MTGRRVYCDDEDCIQLEPGDYVKLASGIFLCRPPDPRFHSGNLAGHSVVEHEDGSITVSPSILITESNIGQWHGFLENGVWREV